MRNKRVARRAGAGHDGGMEDLSGSYHYGVMRRAIAILDAAGGQGLSLEELSARLGMSPAHFQRLFSRWVGVSPKRYQQYLALGQARALLARRMNMQEVAQAVGLSGAGRLHDLFVRWQAMTPGAQARGGAGLVLHEGWFDSPFGPVLAMGTERGLSALAFAAETGRAAAQADLRARWPRADFIAAPEVLAPWVRAAFGGAEGGGQGGVGPVALDLIGEPFQIKVWEALLAIPSGHVTTYGDLAAALGRPGAARAVGTAVGRNPVGWLIPCHRVLRASGGLGGYHWGLPVKRAMLAWEAARLEAGA